ncbi:hypothetical protein PIB30_089578, partial [Stylosanthes scabra]|nr:hypothetical protein [Stylosanthes scabra]
MSIHHTMCIYAQSIPGQSSPYKKLPVFNKSALAFTGSHQRKSRQKKNNIREQKLSKTSGLHIAVFTQNCRRHRSPSSPTYRPSSLLRSGRRVVSSSFWPPRRNRRAPSVLFPCRCIFLLDVLGYLTPPPPNQVFHLFLSPPSAPLVASPLTVAVRPLFLFLHPLLTLSDNGHGKLKKGSLQIKKRNLEAKQSRVPRICVEEHAYACCSYPNPRL